MNKKIDMREVIHNISMTSSAVNRMLKCLKIRKSIVHINLSRYNFDGFLTFLKI